MNKGAFSRPQTAAIPLDGMTGMPVAGARRFERRIDALPDIVAFTAEIFVKRGFDRGLLPAVDFAVEELFTNLVKSIRTSRRST